MTQLLVSIETFEPMEAQYEENMRQYIFQALSSIGDDPHVVRYEVDLVPPSVEDDPELMRELAEIAYGEDCVDSQ